jgi:hypothetical protein
MLKNNSDYSTHQTNSFLVNSAENAVDNDNDNDNQEAEKRQKSASLSTRNSRRGVSKHTSTDSDLVSNDPNWTLLSATQTTEEEHREIGKSGHSKVIDEEEKLAASRRGTGTSSGKTSNRSGDLLSKFVFTTARSKSVRFIERSMRSHSKTGDEEERSALAVSDINDLSARDLKAFKASSNSRLPPLAVARSLSSQNEGSDTASSPTQRTPLVRHNSDSSSQLPAAQRHDENNEEDDFYYSRYESSSVNRPPLYSLNQHNTTNDSKNNNNSLLRSFVKLFRLKNNKSSMSSPVCSSPSDHHQHPMLSQTASPGSIDTATDTSNYCC